MAQEITYKLTRNQYLVAIGYGLWLASTTAVLSGGYRYLLAEIDIDSYILPLDFILRGTTFSLSLFAFGALAYRFSDRKQLHSVIYPFSVFTLGNIILIVLYLTSCSNSAAILLVSFFFSAGSGMTFCLYQRILANQKIFTTGLIVFLAAIISAVIYFSLSLAIGINSLWITTIVITALSLIIVNFSQRTEAFSHPMYDMAPKQHRDRLKAALSELWRPLVCIVFSAFIEGLVRVQGIYDSEFALQINALMMVGLFVSSTLLIAFWRYLYSRVTLLRL